MKAKRVFIFINTRRKRKAPEEMGGSLGLEEEAGNGALHRWGLSGQSVNRMKLSPLTPRPGAWASQDQQPQGVEGSVCPELYPH